MIADKFKWSIQVGNYARMRTRVKLLGGGVADVDHTETIEGYSQIIGGYMPPSPRVSAPLVSKNFFRGYLFGFVEYLNNRSHKIKIKNFKNYGSILTIVNHRNWLDKSPLLIVTLVAEIFSFFFQQEVIRHL